MEESEKPDAAAMIFSYSQTIIDKLSDLNVKEYASLLKEELDSFKKKVDKEGIRIQDQAYYDTSVSYLKPDLSRYEDWCWNYSFWLNPMSVFPFRMDSCSNDSLKWMPGGALEIRFKDVMATYDHARRLYYQYSLQPIDDRGFRKTDMEFAELLQDCYIRLYSIIDKIAKLLGLHFLGLEGTIPPFHEIVKSFENDSNCYLRGLYEINMDFSKKIIDGPDRIKLGIVDPYYSKHRVTKNPFFLRDMMAHAAINYVENGTEISKMKKYEAYNVLSMSYNDLEVETQRLLWRVREVILHFYLAVR